jgi:hypothetical protein
VPYWAKRGNLHAPRRGEAPRAGAACQHVLCSVCRATHCARVARAPRPTRRPVNVAAFGMSPFTNGASLQVLLVVLACGGSRAVNIGQRQPKRDRPNAAGASYEHLLSRAAEFLQITTPPFVFNAKTDPGGRLALIDALWAGTWVKEIANRFTHANPALRYLLELQEVDGDEGSTVLRALAGQSRWEAVMSALFRARSRNNVPIETAAMSIAWLYYRVPKPVWGAMTYFGRAVMSRTWAETLCDLAMERDPGPAYPTAVGISAAVFDNLMMKVGYSSYATGGEAGRKIEMTNWATLFMPASAMPNGFTGIDALLGAGGIFRTDLDIETFIDGFSRHAPDINRNQRARWASFLDQAAAGSIWDTEHYDSPYPQTKFFYHPPIFDRLQSSYDDVNFELDLMRSSIFHKYSDALMLGGDGLSYMRLIHRLSQDPRRYLETKPVVIPRMGENPHGLYHFMHGDWRIWSPLLMRLAVVINNRQVKSDPTIVDFNTHQHFLRIVIQALAEYVVEISQTGSHYSATPQFLKDSEQNLSFAYVVFFLYMFGFKYLDYRSAVRRNRSQHLDLLWRENLASMRTAKGNKTNYRQMAVILIYWGTALVGPLQAFYHNTRTVRWIMSHVGWDMPIEKLNMWIKASVVANISEGQICQFIRRLNFMQHVMRGLRSLVFWRRARDTATPIDIRVDVDKVKDFLRGTIGTTYAAATLPSDVNLLGVDMADWGGLRRPRACAPFQQIRNAEGGYREYVRRQLVKLCPWHHWV